MTDPEGRSNLLEMFPEAKYALQKIDEGKYQVEVPKFRNSFWKFFCRLFNLGENIKVSLDDVGAFVYEKCDGANSVAVIIKESGKRFGEKIDPVPDRVVNYMKMLERNGLILMKKNPASD